MNISRREAMSITLAAGVAAATSPMVSAAESKDPGLKFVFEVTATLEKPLIFGQTGIYSYPTGEGFAWERPGSGTWEGS